MRVPFTASGLICSSVLCFVLLLLFFFIVVRNDVLVVVGFQRRPKFQFVRRQRHVKHSPIVAGKGVQSAAAVPVDDVGILILLDVLLCGFDGVGEGLNGLRQRGLNFRRQRETGFLPARRQS